MNYKLNTLTEDIECKEVLINDFPALHFGSTPMQTVVFDATAYCKIENLPDINHVQFGKACGIYIDRMLNNGNISNSELFFQTPNGRLLVNKSLTYIFLAFVNGDAMDYFFGLLDEIFTNGFTVSDSFITAAIEDRVPSNFLRMIIEKRKEYGEQF